MTASASSSKKLEAGDKIAGRYRLVRRLGEGGMGTIWEVYNEAVERTFAIKLLHPRLAKDPIGVQRFLDEAKAAGRVRHPGVVEVVDAGKLDDRRGALPYMVMEKLDGEPLDQRLRRGAMNVGEALRTVRDAARGVAAAHAAGIIHRDIKPANLFLHRREEGDAIAVKVLDFGISKASSKEDVGLTETGVLLGTPSFMSPEQLFGNIADKQTDVWALGVVLYQCLSGQLPFTAEHEGELIQKIREAPPPALPADISSSVAAIVERCLSKKPADRFATADLLAKAIDEELSAIEARTKVVVVAPSTSQPKNAKLSTPVIAVAAGIALVVILFFALRKKDTTPEATSPTASLSTTETAAAPAPSSSMAAAPSESSPIVGMDDPPSSSAPRVPRNLRRPFRIHTTAATSGPHPSTPPSAPTPPADPLRKPGF